MPSASRGRPVSPGWTDPTQDSQRDDSPDSDGLGLGKALKGFFKSAVNPNQPNPANPIVNGVVSEKKSFWRNAVADILAQLPRVGENYELVSTVLQSKLFDGGVVDDKSYQMEKVIQLVASLANDSPLQDDLSGSLIKLLWENLEHPPISKLGNEYKYRQADGSGNNIMYPHLGKAGSTYARTVIPKTLQPGILPDPGVIFDSLFARGDNVKEHPNKISSMLFYWATLITHDLFQTDDRDRSKVKTSSYLDLAPLYGNNEQELAKIRAFKDGLLQPDTFCERRVLGHPPGVAALLVCFNRYHNYVAIQLKGINERGRFDVPTDPNDEAGFKRLDNDLFQTARLVTCGLYVNVILHDYVRTILNLNRTDTSWTLDPRDSFSEYFDEKGVPSGIGNQVSVEFNLVYRWHSMTSHRDAQWTSDLYNEIFPEDKVEDLSERAFLEGLRRKLETQGSDPLKWTIDFGRYQRTERGTFRDEDIVQILQDATEHVTCSFGPRQIPITMKLIETLGIKQARSWNVATLNEFRQFFKLKPYETFSEITSDRDVAHALKSLYQHPDYVELYPGLIAEDAKEAGPASGLCPGYTISRTILADAVALVRGDRFYTVDYTPANLTNWGYNQIQPDQDVAFGHCIYNLFMRAVPGWHRGNSVYAMFPFVIPQETENILRHLKQDHKYNFDRPEHKPSPKPIMTWGAAVNILGDQTNFKVPWYDHTQALIGRKYPYMLSVDNEQGLLQRHAVGNAIYCPVDGLKHIQDFYEALTTQLIEIQSERLRDSWFQLDACRDVANPSHAIFVSRLWHLPVRGPEDRTLGATVDELYLAFATAFAYVFLDADTARSFKLKNGAQKACDKLALLCKTTVEAVKFGTALNLSPLFDMGRAGEMLSEYGTKLIQRLLNDGKSVGEVVAIIIPTAAATVGLQAQCFTTMLDLYLSEPYKKHWPAIQKLAWADDKDAFEDLKMYALEACRLRPASYGLLRNVANDITKMDGDRKVDLRAGDVVYLNFVAAGRDPHKFPNPDEVDITRSKDSYIHHGWGPHSCLGRQITEVAMAAQLKVFAKLKNLRRAPGPQGLIKQLMPEPNPVSSDPEPNPGVPAFMREDWSSYWPFPTTLKVHHDGFLADQEELLLKETGLPHRSTDLRESRQANGQANGSVPVTQLNGVPILNGEANGR